MISLKALLKRAFYTYCPRFIFKFSPSRMAQRDHWKNQNEGDVHGYQHYDQKNEARDQVLRAEIKRLIKPEQSMLDLGCNCGRDLYENKHMGYKKLTGIDICRSAIEHGKKKFDLSGVELIVGSYEEVLPDLIRNHRTFDLVYSGGASMAMVHPSFDIVSHICQLSNQYVILVNEDSTNYAYPRFWEHEFKRCGFILVKLMRPFNGTTLSAENAYSTFAVYQKLPTSSL